MNALQDAINDAKAKAEDFNAREKVFGFPPTDYPILNKIEEDLQVSEPTHTRHSTTGPWNGSLCVPRLRWLVLWWCSC